MCAAIALLASPVPLLAMRVRNIISPPIFAILGVGRSCSCSAAHYLTP
ncbi:MAG: hypothetical protein OJF49_003995 [Ktedonobacterales bacterium]|nr:MAG: hypothetical protein OJF49_003995 [Ktedonobacterales bacterium]